MTSSCPDQRNLERFLLAQLPDREAEAVEQHLLECAACCGKAGELKAEDLLVEAMQWARANPAKAAETDAVEDLVNHLCGLMSAINHEPSEATVGPSGSMAVPAPETTRNLYDFLAPPEGPGEIGRLGPYRVRKLLGIGGMGVVFLAEDPQLRRPVALKTLNRSLAAHPAARQRFLREAQAAAALDHDHVVTIHQVGEDRGVPFLAMQLLQGESLEERLKRVGRFSVAEVLRIGREVAEGLAAAHARGLIHRDIKPANIWLECRSHKGPVGERVPAALAATGGRVKIVDFGLARAAVDDAPLVSEDDGRARPECPAPLMTETGAVMGTPAYMAPEQALGEALDHRCDLFSLGCLLYRMATGQLPFAGRDWTERMRALTREEPQPPAALNPALPAVLSELIVKLLAKRPEDRYPSAQAVAAALAAIEASFHDATWRTRRVVWGGVLLGLVMLAAAALVYRASHDRSARSAPPIYFELGPNYAVEKNPYAVAIADVNGDGSPDLLASNIKSDSISVLLADTRASEKPNASSFKAANHFRTGSEPHALVVADFNGDRRLDVAVASFRDNSVNILSGNGDGSFAPPVAFRAGAGTRGLTTGDFNGDGSLDLATANDHGHSVSTMLGNGDGSFRSAAEYPIGKFPVFLTAVDLDRDGRLDLAAANGGDDTVSVLLGHGDGSFREAANYATGSGPGMIGVADFDGDGHLDLAVENFGGNDVSVLLGRGDGSYRPAVTCSVGSGPGGLVTADFNGDGRPDLAVANHHSNNVSLLAGAGNGTFRPSGSLPAGVMPAGMAAADLDGDGRTDLVVPNHRSDDLSVFLNRPPGPNFRLTAASSTVVGSPTAVRVTALNADGHNDTGSTRNVRLACSDANAEYTAEQAFSPMDRGVRSFTIVLNTPGPQTLSAIDTASGAVLGRALIVVNRPARAGQFHIEAPERVRVGNAFAVTVAAQDAAGNLMPEYLGEVSFSSTDELAAFPGKYQFNIRDNGVRELIVTFQNPGRQTLTVTDAANPAIRGNVDILVEE